MSDASRPVLRLARHLEILSRREGAAGCRAGPLRRPGDRPDRRERRGKIHHRQGLDRHLPARRGHASRSMGQPVRLATAEAAAKAGRHRDPSGNRAVRRTDGGREHLPRPCAAHPLRPDRLGRDERDRRARCWSRIGADARSRDRGCATSASPRATWSPSPARCRSTPAWSSWTNRPPRCRTRKSTSFTIWSRRLKAEGKAILFISHKFDEIFRIADRYTVFRDGQFVGAGPMAEVTEGQLVQMMVGRAVDQIFPKRAPQHRRARPDGRGLQPPDRIRGYRLHPAHGRDPGLLRPGRRRAGPR